MLRDFSPEASGAQPHNPSQLFISASREMLHKLRMTPHSQTASSNWLLLPGLDFPRQFSARDGNLLAGLQILQRERTGLDFIFAHNEA